MQEINARIIKQNIISSNIFISQTLEKNFQLNMTCKVKLKTPKDEENKSVLLNMKLNLESKDEKLKVELISDIIFELDRMPENYDEIAEKKVIPMAQESLLNSLDEILIVMGYSKMELTKK